MRSYILVIVMLFVVLPCGYAREWNVPGDFEKIQAACAAAQNGDTIIVAAGNYSDKSRVEIPAGVTLQGTIEQGIPRSIITCNDGLIAVDMGASAVISGFEINGVEGLVSQGIFAYEDCQVSYMVLRSYIVCGIVLSADKIITIDHVTVDGLPNGISAVRQPIGARIRDCVIRAREGVTSHNGPLDADYMVLDSEEPYVGQAVPGPHDIIGSAELNPCGIPIPPSVAYRSASDSTDRGAGQFVWDAPSADFRLTLGGGWDDGRGMMFSFGNEFRLDVSLAHDLCGGLNLRLYVILAAYGQYYFWPTWQQVEAFEARAIPENGWTENVLQFVWPEVAGRGEATFWAAGFIPGTASEETLLTPVASAPFSWGE